MALNKPFHRTVRNVVPGPNSGYSEVAFIEDVEYAESPAQYTRALLLILNDIKSIFEYVEPSDEGRMAFSYRIHALLMRTCIEIEANFKAIFQANVFTPPSRRSLNINDFRKIDVTHHLSSYEARLPIWNGSPPAIRPFEVWRAFRGQSTPQGISLSWYRAYNASKHSRQQDFKQANLWTLIEAIAALVIVVTAQFRDMTFDAGPSYLLADASDEFVSSIGDLFLIKYTDDWSEDEIYDFDWSCLRQEAVRFNKINYDAIL